MSEKSQAKVHIRLLRAIVVLLGIALAAAHFDELHFMLDNLSNFPLHFAAAFLVCAILLAVFRDLRFLVVAAAGVVFSLAPVAPWYFAGTAQPPAPDADTVKLLVSNIYVRNRQHAGLLRLIEEQRPDVVALMEVNSLWLRSLEPLRMEYPFHVEAPDESAIGLSLYSKLPLSNPRVLHIGDPGAPSIAATLQTPDGEVEIILVHPMPPVGTSLAQRRNAQLHAASRYVRELDRPVVLVGDLNVTLWNRNYRTFAELGGLHSARAGHGVGPTWPAIGPFGVPIDHIVATSHVRFRNFRVRENIGSDHLPISAEFSLR